MSQRPSHLRAALHRPSTAVFMPVGGSTRARPQRKKILFLLCSSGQSGCSSSSGGSLLCGPPPLGRATIKLSHRAQTVTDRETHIHNIYPLAKRSSGLTRAEQTLPWAVLTSLDCRLLGSMRDCHLMAMRFLLAKKQRPREEDSQGERVHHSTGFIAARYCSGRHRRTCAGGEPPNGTLMP